MPAAVSSAAFWLIQFSAVTVLFVPFTWGLVGLWAASHFLRAIGLTLAFHRYFAHRAFEMARPVRFFWAFVGTAAMQKGPLWWAAHHRLHHRHSDTDEDPHSPVIYTFWKAHVGWLFEKKNDVTHWRMIRGAAIIDVTAPRRMHRQPGISFHRCEVPRDEATVRHGIPVVCPARAILDLAATVTGRPLERALNEARVLRLPERPSLRELIDRYPGRRGIRAAREALALFEAGPTPTRSELEERFLALIDRSTAGDGSRAPMQARRGVRSLSVFRTAARCR